MSASYSGNSGSLKKVILEGFKQLMSAVDNSLSILLVSMSFFIIYIHIWNLCSLGGAIYPVQYRQIEVTDFGPIV